MPEARFQSVSPNDPDYEQRVLATQSCTEEAGADDFLFVPSMDGVTTYTGGELDDLTGRQLAHKLEGIPGSVQSVILERRAEFKKNLKKALE